MNDEAIVPTEKRGPGRPPVALKKGNPSWKPANVDETFGKEDGYRYRWINKDEANLAKKKQERWEVVSGIGGQNTTTEAGTGRIDDGKQLTSVRERFGQVLARMPEEDAKQRDNYFNNESARRVKALRKQAQKDLGDADAPIHGSISMEKRGIRTVIKD